MRSVTPAIYVVGMAIAFFVGMLLGAALQAVHGRFRKESLAEQESHLRRREQALSEAQDRIGTELEPEPVVWREPGFDHIATDRGWKEAT